MRQCKKRILSGLSASLLVGIFTLPLVPAPSWAAVRSILLLAHGQMDMSGAEHAHMNMPEPVWNRNVEALARALNKTVPTEIAFGMAEAPAIQAAVDRLEARGATEIAAVPLFISSHSPIIGNFRYILGLADQPARTTAIKTLTRITHHAKIAMTPAMDDHALISQILLERAMTAARAAPAEITVLLLAHGPNDAQENRLWLEDLKVHAAYLEEHGHFRAVSVATRRDDADAGTKDEALREIRALVEAGDRQGSVIVVPVLLSEGGIEAELNDDLKGLTYTFARPLLPDPKVGDWVKAMFRLATN